MFKEIEPLRQEKRSRLDSWEEDPRKLYFPYFPNKGDESPLFAHIIALKALRKGKQIPDEVGDVLVNWAERKSPQIKVNLTNWNFFVMANRLPKNKDKYFIEMRELIADTFGEKGAGALSRRVKLMSDAVTFESSIFSSVSVN